MADRHGKRQLALGDSILLDILR